MVGSALERETRSETCPSVGYTDQFIERTTGNPFMVHLIVSDLLDMVLSSPSSADDIGVAVATQLQTSWVSAAGVALVESSSKETLKNTSVVIPMA